MIHIHIPRFQKGLFFIATSIAVTVMLLAIIWTVRDFLSNVVVLTIFGFVCLVLLALIIWLIAGGLELVLGQPILPHAVSLHEEID